jgi:RNA polymerase sigma-70 factor (ECF subfamily)
MSYSNLDDLQLLQLVQNENEEAFAEVYNRYWKLLYTTAYSVIQDEYFAKEAVQEVFISLWQRKEGANIQVLKAYLQQAVRFQVLKSIRTQKTDEHFYMRLAAVTADIIYDNPLLFKEQEALLKEIMDALPADCRVVFELSREEHLTYKQIANHLNISEKTVEKKMSICLKYIRQRLEQNKILLVLLLMTLSLRGFV